MTYFTNLPNPNEGRVEYRAGVAFSDDGTAWEKSDLSPLFTSSRYGFNGVFLATMVFVEGTYRLYFDVQSGFAGKTAVWLSAHDGPLRSHQ